MLFEPSASGYSQSGINTAARIVEVVSGMPFDQFLQRLFDPLGMKDATFYPTEAQLPRVVTVYAKNKETGELVAAPRGDIPRPSAAQRHGAYATG